MAGRWFWGAYDEFGVDVTLRRVAGDPVVATVDRTALKASPELQQITIFGANFPAGLKSGEITLGPGIAVNRIVNNRPDAVTLEVSVAGDAPIGLRDVSIRQSVATGAIAVFDKVDYIKVRPDTGLARVGGSKYPKEYQQFEALGYNRGPDGQPETADDINLGPQNVEWFIEEFPGSYFDDDRDFVGTIDKNGLFTPSLEGPNPARRNSRNNYGEVWVVASRKSEDGRSDAASLKARSYLVVTLPLYVRWDTPEISR
jgi:quinohemoprotein amine dehydrogenase